MFCSCGDDAFCIPLSRGRRAGRAAGDSPNWGLTFCVGTWAEGGDAMGRNVFEMIRDFGARGEIFEVHFRNVTGPLPHFVETLPDDGYIDMGHDCTACMRALLRRANEEVG